MALPRDLDPNRASTPEQSGSHLRVISSSSQPESYLSRIRNVRPTSRDIAKGILILILATAAPVGIVYSLSSNDPQRQNMRVEPRVLTISTPKPNSVADCEAFSAGDPMFEECMKEREFRKQTMTP